MVADHQGGRHQGELKPSKVRATREGHVKRLLCAAAFAAAVAGISSALAQPYPSRPITMIIPANAGGPTDTIGRILAQGMQVSLGQNVIIENIGGASGTLGTNRLVRAAPDGYTIGLGGWNHYVVNGAAFALAYDLLNDFAPVSLIAAGPQLILTRKDVPANDLKELIGWLKARPESVTFGTGGVASPGHISGLAFQNVTGTRFVFVPHRGAGPAMQNMVAGQIDMTFDQPTGALPQVRAGTIKAYAVTAKTRLASAPDIPTVDEAGMPGFYVSIWHGLWVPKATPQEMIAKLNAAIVDALGDPAVRARLADLGQDIPPREQQTPEALGAYHKAEIEKWWPIIRAAGIKAE
jgi:tripartite-type tricarboxylate transporter receptor subunit TctC